MPTAIPAPASADMVTGAPDTETGNVSSATPNGQISKPVRTRILSLRPAVPPRAFGAPADHGAPPAGDPEPDQDSRAAERVDYVGGTRKKQARTGRRDPPLDPFEARSSEVPEDAVDGSRHIPAVVRVLDPETERRARAASEETAKDRYPKIPDVYLARGARSEPGPDGESVSPPTLRMPP